MIKQSESVCQSFPTVTIAIPTYNEAKHIDSVVKGFLETGYPNLLEILVADGESSDETQNIVKKLSLLDSRVKLLLNPLKIQSAALNLMLAEAKGEVFLRADAHCDYAPDYIERCVEALLESNAFNVGGAQRFVATNGFQSGLALASRSFLGNGGAKYRNPNYSGYADTVFIGCFWKQDLLELENSRFKKVNRKEVSNLNSSDLLEVFDVSQVTNQDAELNLRLKEKKTSAIYVSSKIKVEYYPRKTCKTLFIQYFKYGRGRYLTFLKHPQTTPVRSRLPLALISLISLIFFIDRLFLHGKLYSQVSLGIIMLLIFIESLRITYKNKDNFVQDFWRGNQEKVPSFLHRVFWCYVALLIMPIAYFSGNIYQIFRHNVFNIEGKY
jgi:succinoglycan biosynthesis protein ExoA